MHFLEVDSLNFSYGRNQILSDIYLKVSQGEVVGFLGRNGCGKSTLLKVIFGSIRGESQSVRIDGQYYSQMLSSGRVKFLTQERIFPNYLTPEKAAKLFDSATDKLKAFEEYKQHVNFKFSSLSSGMAKFLETLILLYSSCEFLLLDEPFSFVAPVHVEKLIPAIRDEAKSKGILLTDHRYESILQVSDSLYLMNDRSLHPIHNQDDLRDWGYVR